MDFQFIFQKNYNLLIYISFYGKVLKQSETSSTSKIKNVKKISFKPDTREENLGKETSM